ncbi:putative hemolysin [Vibrio sp.]|uniref:putative hemolysin n=1 Tax=Vibrio sp. TaxID=678 RepID=UPI003D0F3EED
MKTLPVMFVSIAIFIVGCSSESNPYKVDDWAEVSNPATIYCVHQGGQLKMTSEGNQRVTYCLLEDGSMREQWEYYRASQNMNNG